MSATYIHGFSRAEQSRLLAQARVLAPNVFAGIDFSTASEALEIGCGVGAELKIMAERWPHLELTGLDQSRRQLGAARDVLGDGLAAGRIRLVNGDARWMPFADHRFDLAITIWMLEHVSEPVAVLGEALRVLKGGGRLVCTEVDNSTLRFEPECRVITRWWDCFNEYQRDAGGDPYVGKKLEGLAARLPCDHVEIEVLPIISSRREPQRRRILLDYLQGLLLSGAGNMTASGMVDEAFRDQLLDAFERVRRDAKIEFQYHAVRMVCQAGEAHRPA